jgi:hypothetical protein
VGDDEGVIDVFSFSSHLIANNLRYAYLVSL